MSRIIKISANENGSRPPLQDWNYEILPNGYAWCPDEFVSVFYSTSPAGFVNISTDGEFVVDMSVNETALNEYISLVDDMGEDGEVTSGNGS